MPKTSVIMPAYNAEKYIGEAIESILNQTYKDFEFIIINDGSTDKTKDIILSYSDDRIVYFENKKNSGIVFSLNKGLEKSTGEYIVRMDADDISVPTRIKKQVEYMDANKDVGVLGTGICIFGENIKSHNRVFTTNSDQLKAELIFNSCIAHPTVMIRSEVLKRNNLKYDARFAGAEDYCLWWEIAKLSKIATMPDILVKYRIHFSQITKTKDQRYFKIMNELLARRFSDIGFEATESDKEVFMKYCLGDYASFTKKDVKVFIDCLAAVLKCNKKNKYFVQTKLVKIFELAIIYLLNNSKLSKAEKRQAYKYAISADLFTMITRVKVFYHQMFR